MSGAIAERESRIAALVADAAHADAASSADDERSAALDARVAERSIDLETATAHATSIRAEVDRLHRALGEASTRLEVLQRMHESGAGLYAGVREALAAGRDGRLKGVLGTVAELIVVPGLSKSPSRSPWGATCRTSGRRMVQRRGGHRPPEAVGRGPRHLSAVGYRSSGRVEMLATTLEDYPGFWAWPRIWSPRRRRLLRSLPHCSGGRWWPTTWSPRERRCSTSPRAGASSLSPGRSPTPVVR